MCLPRKYKKIRQNKGNINNERFKCCNRKFIVVVRSREETNEGRVEMNTNSTIKNANRSNETGHHTLIPKEDCKPHQLQPVITNNPTQQIKQ